MSATEFELETDGRWLCEVGIGHCQGVMAYGQTREEAELEALRIYCRVLEEKADDFKRDAISFGERLNEMTDLKRSVEGALRLALPQIGHVGKTPNEHSEEKCPKCVAKAALSVCVPKREAPKR